MQHNRKQHRITKDSHIKLKNYKGRKAERTEELTRANNTEIHNQVTT